MQTIEIPAGYVSASFESDTRLGVITRRVLRREATGPTVILIHESPGLSSTTFGVAAALIEHDYRIVLPVLLDAAWASGLAGQAASVLKLCVARELSALAAGRSSAIVEWLRGLAAYESTATDGRPIAVIGMCFSGGFALGTILDPHVDAAVMSQPALPVMLPFLPASLGVSARELDVIHRRIGAGDCIRAMRFSRDAKSPRARLDLIKREFPDAECVEIETDDRSLHSVLALSVDAPPGSQLGMALPDTIAFLDRHLKAPTRTSAGVPKP